MKIPELTQFNLVGGTALALQIGHRISVDLDLFTSKDFDSTLILSLVEPLGNLDLLVDKPPFLQIRINDLKVDFLKYPYSFVQEYNVVEEIRLAPIENIAVMKLLAIVIYFDDAELEADPRLLKKTNWAFVKKTIIKETTDYLKGFKK